MGDLLCLLTFCLNRRSEYWELLSTLLHVTKVKFIKECSSMAAGGAGMEGIGLEIVFYEYTRGWNHEKDAVLSENIKTWDIKMSDTQHTHS